MPVYDYRCKQHGLFNEVQTLAQHAAPCRCPRCGVFCARVVVLPPMVSQVAPAMKRAHVANERAQHAPRTRAEFEEHQCRHNESNGYCSHRENPLGQRKSGLLYTAQGEKLFIGQRPWMISH